MAEVKDFIIRHRNHLYRIRSENTTGVFELRGGVWVFVREIVDAWEIPHWEASALPFDEVCKYECGMPFLCRPEPVDSFF